MEPNLKCISPGSAICAVSFSSLKDEASEVVAVACKNGQWLVLDTLTREVIFKSSDGVEPLLCAQFAPNNQFIAFGSADHSIYVYQVTDLCHKYLKVGKCVVSIWFVNITSFLRNQTFFWCRNCNLSKS